MMVEVIDHDSSLPRNYIAQRSYNMEVLLIIILVINVAQMVHTQILFWVTWQQTEMDHSEIRELHGRYIDTRNYVRPPGGTIG